MQIFNVGKMRGSRIIFVAVLSLIMAVLTGCGSGGWGDSVHKNVYVAPAPDAGDSSRANSIFVIAENSMPCSD